MTPRLPIDRGLGFGLRIGAVLALLSCSEVPEGGNGAGAGGGAGGGGGGNTGCTGEFCIETDVRIGATPNPLIFSDIAPPASQEQQLVIKHQGSSGSLQVSKITFDPDEGEFAVKDFQPLQIAVNAEQTVTVVYTPKKSGPRSVMLRISNNSDKVEQREFQVPVQVKANVGSLNILPNPVDFGPVASGTCADKVAKIYNAGSKPTSVVAASLWVSGSPDFKIKTPPSSEAIAPNAAVDVVLTFCPKPGEDIDSTELMVEDQEGKVAVAKVLGAEITPKMTIVPPTINYGAVQLGSKNKKTFKIFSDGLSPLTVSKIEFAPQSKVKSLTLSDAGPFTLQKGESRSIEVTLDAATGLANDGSPIAIVFVASNDLAKPSVSLPVFAKTETGVLKVTPDDFVDFSTVGKGLVVDRVVSLFNAGSAPIQVKSLTITSDPHAEFQVLTSADLPPTSGAGPHALGAGKGAEFKVRFTFKGPVGQQAKGNLRISSDDPSKPEWDLPLFATRADGTNCNIQFVPNILNFGVLSYGSAKTLALTVKNIGSGYCLLDVGKDANGKDLPAATRVLDCAPPPSLPGLPALGSAKCALIGAPAFTVFAPSTALFELAPGQSGKLNVFFDAPTDGGLFADPKTILKRFGLVSIRYRDQSTGLAKWFPLDPTDAAKVPTYAPNLEAGVGQSAVTVLPDQIDFGLVTVGCKSKVHEVSVYNAGITPVYVTKVELDGCGIEIDKVAWPGIPKVGLEVTQTVPVKFGLQYAPQNVGKDACQMVVTTGVNGLCTDAVGNTKGDCQTTADCAAGEGCLGQVFTVPLKGEGTLLDEFTDEFEQGAGKKVDVLFVIDNSGSMGDEQQNLVDNFKTFVQIATLWQNDYHLGVVTTDMDKGNESGKLREMNGTRIITPTTSGGADLFKQVAKVGTSGSASEQGLAAAESALKLPHVYDAGKACTVDKDCGTDGFCVKDADGPGKGCGGHNRGFLRKNAGLEIVFLSDEEDSSPQALKYYANFFWSLKGIVNKGLFHAHAIVGLQNNGGSGSSGCDAAKGSRYITVAQDSGGQVASICDKSFSKALENIGQVAFGLSHQFFLTMTAEASTVTVSINNKPCTGGAKTWSYEPNSNSVIFIAAAAGGQCVPQQGDKVKIYYKTLCFP